MYSTTSRSKFSGVKLTSHHRELFRDAAMAGKFSPWRKFLTQGGNPKELKDLDFSGHTLRQVAQKTADTDDIRLLREYGLA